MNLKIQWTSLALKDLLSIKEYIRRDKPIAAKQEAQKIKKSVERLSRFPQSGRKVDRIPGIREVIIGNYCIFYRIHLSKIEILRVYHGRQDFLMSGF